MNRRKIVFAAIACPAVACATRVAFAQTAPSDLIQRILSQMPEQLSTDLSRVGVSAIARSVVEFRSKVGPREYDRGESWRSEALKHLDDVQPVLMQAPPQEARDRLAADAPKLDALVNSFRQNQTTFAAFANQMRDDPSSGGMLRETEANILLRSQLYLAAYFRLLGDQKYAAITKFTLIWPFC